MTTPRDEDRDTTRQFVTERRFDPQTNPPQYVDVELPTDTIKFQGALRTSRERGPHGTELGSYYLSGSFHPIGGKGTNSLRITRLSLSSGSRNNAWHIRHSRDGTVDVQEFLSAGARTIVGEGLKPVYSFGPGSITWGWLGDSLGAMGTGFNMTQSMEGLLG